MTGFKQQIKMFSEKVRSFVTSNPVSCAIFLLAISLWITLISCGSKFYADEKYHYKQISWFTEGKFEIIPMLTTIPGYHAFVSLFAMWFDDLSFLKVRIISFSISLTIIPLFYFLAKQFGAKEPLKKTLQFIFLPIAFIYVPLVYTDIFSTILILLALFFAVRQKYHTAAIISIASIAVRQNNIVWHTFIWVYSFVSLHGFSLSPKIIWNYFRKSFLFPLGILLFAVFVILNEGIAVGDRTGHQAGFYLGNIYFFLVIAGVLFFPITISRIIEIVRLKSWRKIGVGITVGLLISTSFAILLPQLHPYNGDLRFLRNIILNVSYHDYKWAYMAAIFLGYLSLHTLKLQKNSFLVYPFTAMYLLPSWLIEQRYAIVSISLLLVMRKEESAKTEWLTIFYYIALSALLLWMLISTKLFF